jgi:hypothetical protein
MGVQNNERVALSARLAATAFLSPKRGQAGLIVSHY